MPMFKCSVCGFQDERPNKPKACPNCGAKSKDNLFKKNIIVPFFIKVEEILTMSRVESFKFLEKEERKMIIGD